MVFSDLKGIAEKNLNVFHSLGGRYFDKALSKHDIEGSSMDLWNLQNNKLSGTIPSGLVNYNLVLRYTGNPGLRKGKSKTSIMIIIIGASVGAAILLTVSILSYLFMNKGKKRYSNEDEFVNDLPIKRPVSSFKSDAATESAHCFPLAEIEDATKKFEEKIGSGGFGVVYY